MVHQYLTSIPGPQVLRLAKAFFAERVPLWSAYVEKEGPGYLVLRGQGGEEIAMSVSAGAEGTHIRASTLLFDQAVDRFLSTLPSLSVESL
jgi:hypothetical protein